MLTQIHHSHLALALVLATATSGLAKADLILNAAGLGQIRSETSFSVDALRDLHPEFQWVSVTRSDETGERRAIEARENTSTVFTVLGNPAGTVAGIEVASRKVITANGARIGSKYRSLRSVIGTCEPGEEALSGHVVCASSKSPQPAFIFSGPWGGPDDILPSPEIMENWQMSQMIWQAEASQPAATPFFNCADTFGSVEEMICNDPELARLDQRLNEVYNQHIELSDPDEQLPLRAAQRGWIKARNDCYKSSDPRACVVSMYQDRIKELEMQDDLSNLSGTAWQVAHGKTRPDLTFEAKGSISGQAGCNRYFGRFVQDGTSLSFDQIGATRKLCPESDMRTERAFLEALATVTEWKMENGQLVLRGGGDDLILSRLE